MEPPVASNQPVGFRVIRLTLRGEIPETFALCGKPAWRTTDDQGASFGQGIFAVCVAVLAMLLPTPAASQTTTQNLAEDTGAPDFFRPPPNQFQAMTEYKTAPGSTREVTTETLNCALRPRRRPAHRAGLSRRGADLPLLAKNPISASNPNGDYLLWQRRCGCPGGAHSQYQFAPGHLALACD